MRKRFQSTTILLVVLAALGASLSAQTDEALFEEFQFNFSTPGARASAMGRAFVGLANDATTSVTNPAGLVTLGSNYQFYFEYKNVDQFIRRGTEVDSLFSGNLARQTNQNDLVPSFLNFSWKKGRWVVSGTYHQFLRLQDNIDQPPRPIPLLVDSVTQGGLEETENVYFTTFPVLGNLDIRGDSYGGSLAYEFVRDKLSAGITVTANRMDIAGGTQRLNYQPTSVRESRYEDLQIIRTGGGQSQPVQSVVTTIDDQATAVGFIAGVLYRRNYTDAQGGPRGFSVGTPGSFSLGAFYSRGPKFEFEETLQVNPDIDQQLNNLEPFGDSPLANGGFPLTIKVPDRVGFGGAVYTWTSLLLVGDAVWIRYSDLVRDFTPIFFQNEQVRQNLGRNGAPLTNEEFSSLFRVEDGWEAHGGFELRLVGPFGTGVVSTNTNTSVFLRGGFFTNPDHRQRFQLAPGATTTENLPEQEALRERTIAELQSRFPGVGVFTSQGRDIFADDREIGLTAGVGVDFLRLMRIDAAYVDIDSFREVVVSVAVRW